MGKRKTSKSIGDELEQRVAFYYEAMGYHVARDVLLQGHQVDLLASRYLPGVGDVKIAIEVKSRNSILGVNDVTHPIEKAKHLLESGRVTTAVLVTNATVSRQARLAVEGQLRLKLITVGELEYHLFNNAEALLRVVSDYESRTIFRSYYALSAVMDNVIQDDVASFIQTWAVDSHGLLLLIGDFGSGKSTILERVFYVAAKERISDRDALFPVLLPLRGLRRFGDLWQFVETSLRDNQYISPSRLVFENELEQGRLLLLLDGFDEIYSGATAQERAGYLDFLRPILKSKSPIVLSSRPTFFQSFDDLMRSIYKLNVKEDSIERLPDFGIDVDKIARVFGSEVNKSFRRRDFAKVLEVKQLDKLQIRNSIAKQSEIITRNVGMSVDEFEAYLYGIYDLEDLMTRPLLLDMILSTMATGAVDIRSAKTVTSATLYDIYTQQASIRDRKRAINDQELTPETRLDACRALAGAMLRKRDIVLSANEVERAVESVLRETARARIVRAITDIRTCSFLRFADDNALVFTHQSFYEFFVAQTLFRASQESSRAFFSYPREGLSREIMYFLASFARDHESFARFLKDQLQEHHDDSDRSFLYSLAFASGAILDNVELAGGTIQGVTLAKASVRSVFATSVQFSSSNVRKVWCRDWTFDAAIMTACEFREVKMENCALGFSSHGSIFSQVRFWNCEMRVSGKSVSLSDAEIENSTIRLNCESTLSGCTFSASILEFGSQTKIHSDRSIAIRSTASSTTDQLWYRSGSRFKFVDCTLNGLAFSGWDLSKNRRNRGEQSLELHNCRGVIYIEMTVELENEQPLQDLRNANPQLFIVRSKLIRPIQEFCQEVEDEKKQTIIRQTNKSAIAAHSSDDRSKGKALATRYAEVGVLYTDLKGHVEKWGLNIADLPRFLREFLSLDVPSHLRGGPRKEKAKQAASRRLALPGR